MVVFLNFFVASWPATPCRTIKCLRYGTFYCVLTENQVTFYTTRVLVQKLAQIVDIVLDDHPDIALSNVLGNLIS